MLAEIDLSDGFWRMIVEEEAKWNFAYVIPDPPGTPPRLVVPSALQTGWAENPAYFCVATETGQYLIHHKVEQKVLLPIHSLEIYMRPTKTPKRSLEERPQYSIFVYLDDFIGTAVENASGKLLDSISKADFYGIQRIPPPPEVTGNTGGKYPIYIKKMQKGDARWITEKEIVGFLVDGKAKTFTIPNIKAEDIVAEIRKILKKKWIPLKRYRRIIGNLRHVAIILPSTKGLFLPINKALKGGHPIIGLGNISEIRVALLNLATMVTSLAA